VLFVIDFSFRERGCCFLRRIPRIGGHA
jgi:hypothetical protein